MGFEVWIDFGVEERKVLLYCQSDKAKKLLCRRFYPVPGWRSGYRAGLEIETRKKGVCTSKPVGLWARRGSSPFPGAIFPVKRALEDKRSSITKTYSMKRTNPQNIKIDPSDFSLKEESSP